MYVNKKSTIFVFATALEVVTMTEKVSCPTVISQLTVQLLFQSFVSREAAYKLITQRWTTAVALLGTESRVILKPEGAEIFPRPAELPDFEMVDEPSSGNSPFSRKRKRRETYSGDSANKLEEHPSESMMDSGSEQPSVSERKKKKRASTKPPLSSEPGSLVSPTPLTDSRQSENKNNRSRSADFGESDNTLSGSKVELPTVDLPAEIFEGNVQKNDSLRKMLKVKPPLSVNCAHMQTVDYSKAYDIGEYTIEGITTLQYFLLFLVSRSFQDVCI